MDPEILKQEHRSPIIERRFLKPGMAVKKRSDAGAQRSLQSVGRIEPDQHFMRDLRISWLVGAHQPQAGRPPSRGVSP